MDEVADLNERVDVRMEEVEEDVGSLKREVIKLRNELGELREAHGRLSRQVGELNTLAEDMRRHLHLPRTPEERAAARIEADLRAAERRRLDEEEVSDSEWERHALRLAERRAVRRASTLVGFQGWLVPIGEPDHAESPPREVIDLTDDSEDDVLDLSSEEEQQAVRATLPSALNVINASSVGKLVQLVTASRLTLNHEG